MFARTLDLVRGLIIDDVSFEVFGVFLVEIYIYIFFLFAHRPAKGNEKRMRPKNGRV